MPVNPNKKDETIVNGSKSISKIENGHAFSLRYALAYAEYFNVSLEYLYGLSDIKQPGYDDVIKKLGLSDDAIHKLEEFNATVNNNITYTLNELFAPSRVKYFVELLQAFFDYRYMGYETNNDEYLSLFKINEISKKIAYEFKNIGCKPWK